MTEPEIKRVDTKVVYKNRWMTVREDRVRRPNGDHGLFGVVDKPDYSLIVPFDGELFHLVQQYRYPVNGRYWEFPQGTLEKKPETPPERVAQLELAEETGLRAGSIEKLAKLHQAYGYSNQAVHIFLATDLKAGEPSLEPEEGDLITRAFSREACEEMIDNGKITDLSTVAAFFHFDRRSKVAS